MSNLERSVSLISKLVFRLELNGVSPEIVSPRHFFGESPSHEDCNLFEALIEWLLSEAVVRRKGDRKGDGNGHFYVHELILTSKGFQLLSIEISANLTLREAVHNINSKHGGLAGMGDFVGGVLGGFTKSVSS